MYRRPLVQGLSLLAFLLTAMVHKEVHAEVEYWVSIASYKQLIDAQQAQEQATGRLSDSFTIGAADTDAGSFYRVLAGPYLSKEIANHMLGEARRNGYEGAWILVAEPSAIFEPAYGAESETDEFEFEVPEYNVPSAKPADIPGFNAPERPDRDKEHRLIDEAPPEYRLNRLNRDQTVIDRASPYLLARK